jgi:hypothetical protein
MRGSQLGYTFSSAIRNDMTLEQKRTGVSFGIGTCISVSVFFLSWATGTFDLLLSPQLPGFLVSSALWGFPGFARFGPHPARSALLFPFMMLTVNAVFYGSLTRLLVFVLTRYFRSFAKRKM